MTALFLSGLCALLLASASPQAPPETASEASPETASRGSAAIAAALATCAGDLPRAAEGRWDTFFESAPQAEPAVAARFQAADRAYRARRYPLAVLEFHRTLELAPDFPPALLQLGATYFRLGRHEDLCAVLERFCAVAPGELWRTQALGHGYYGLGRYAEARDHYRRVLDAWPEGGEPSLEAVRGLGLAHLRLGALEASLAELQRVVDGRPDDPEAWAWLAQALFEAGELERAEAAARRSAELAPWEPRPHFLLMQLAFEAGREEEAEALRRRWESLEEGARERRGLRARLLYEPADVDVLRALIEWDQRLGDLAALREDLERLIGARVDPDARVQSAVFALETLMAAGDGQGARRAAQLLAQLGRDEAEVWELLAACWRRMGEEEESARAAARARSLGDR